MYYTVYASTFSEQSIIELIAICIKWENQTYVSLEEPAKAQIKYYVLLPFAVFPSIFSGLNFLQCNIGNANSIFIYALICLFVFRTGFK